MARSERDRRDSMRYWLAMTARELRERQEVRAQDIASVLGMDAATIYRFEKAETWPREIDQVIAGYACLCGLEDGREIWATALGDWRAKGAAPSFEMTRAGSLVARAVKARKS